MIFAPSAAKPSAMPRPRPRLPPVTSATLPASLPELLMLSSPFAPTALLDRGQECKHDLIEQAGLLEVEEMAVRGGTQRAASGSVRLRKRLGSRQGVSSWP